MVSEHRCRWSTCLEQAEDVVNQPMGFVEKQARYSADNAAKAEKSEYRNNPPGCFSLGERQDFWLTAPRHKTEIPSCDANQKDCYNKHDPD